MSFGRKLGRRLWGRWPLTAPDADLVRSLAALMAETGLGEIEYAVGDERIRVARTPSISNSAPAATTIVPPEAGASPPSSGSMGGNGKATNGFDHHADAAGIVKSPMVGVAYLAAQPGDSPFVHIGDTVSEGQTLLIIEAMKVMNQIRAPRAGRLAKVLVGDAEPVEYGAALMLIE
ncbi:MAG TPA: acetyl-CoA carboxylase biotin carboxyl carrier protein subunit [Stellaceae bacterium]|nr:acetyl-CoA carboxylase biotin carboxyl carrier protein subunit [Stellaceae bacterium]